MIWRVNKPTGGLTRVELRTPGPGRDAIFAEDPWNADTDAFISDNTSGGMDDAPAGYDDLGPSYDSYPLLHPKADAVSDEGDEKE